MFADCFGLWELDFGFVCCWLITGCWLLVTGCWLLVTGCWLLVESVRLIDPLFVFSVLVFFV